LESVFSLREMSVADIAVLPVGRDLARFTWFGFGAGRNSARALEGGTWDPIS
jgi:hypothetical protein